MLYFIKDISWGVCEMKGSIPIAVALFVGSIFSAAAMTQDAQAAPVAESCFTVSGGTITNYDQATCGLNPDIPATISGTPITTIGINAFRDKGLTGVTFVGSNLTTIDTNAFYGNSLGAVTLPNSLTTLGVGAFMRAGLASVVLSTGLTSINDQAFYVNSLTSISLHEGITALGFSAFGLNQLTSLTLPSTVTSISHSAFDSNKLTSLTLNNGLAVIGSGAFSSNQLASVTIPNSVTTLGATAFFQNQLTSVTLGTGISTIDDATFAANKLATVSIPSTITSINDYAFTGQNPLGGNWPTTPEPGRTNATWFARLILANPANPNNLQDFASAAPEYIADEMIWLPGGHLIDAVPLTVYYRNQSSSDILATAVLPGEGLTDYTVGQNPTLDLAKYYRIGQTVPVEAPAIAGYIAPTSASVTLASSANAHTFIYAAQNPTTSNTASQLAATGDSMATIVASALGMILVSIGLFFTAVRTKRA